MGMSTPCPVVMSKSVKALTNHLSESTKKKPADVTIERLVWIEEYFWDWNGKPAHGIAFYYMLGLASDIDIPDTGEFVSQKDNCNVVLGWIPIKELTNITIYPSFLTGKVENISDNVEYFKIEYNEIGKI